MADDMADDVAALEAVSILSDYITLTIFK